MGSSSSTDVDPVREIRRLHVMLEDWYLGIREEMVPFEQALAPDFVAINADGQVQDRSEYLSALSAMRAEDPPSAISLSDLEHRRSIYGVHLVTYEKRLDGQASGPTSVTCSIWLRETDRSKTGLQWLALQETPVVTESEPPGEEVD